MSELYPIGKHLRLKPSCSSMLGYTTEIFQVIGYDKNSSGQDLYLTSKIFYGLSNGRYYIFRAFGDMYIVTMFTYKFVITDIESRKIKLQII